MWGAEPPKAFKGLEQPSPRSSPTGRFFFKIVLKKVAPSFDRGLPTAHDQSLQGVIFVGCLKQSKAAIDLSPAGFLRRDKVVPGSTFEKGLGSCHNGHFTDLRLLTDL